MKPILTREIAWALATDSGNRSMRKNNRKKWNRYDKKIAGEEFSRLWPAWKDISRRN